MTRSLAIIALYSTLNASAASYYFSTSGNDANDGLSPATPFKTLTKIASLTPAPGDALLLKAGDTFDTIATFYSAGTSNAPIVMDRYDVGANPIIAGDNPNAAWSAITNGVYSTTPAAAATVEILASPSGTVYAKAANTNGYEAWPNWTWAIDGSQVLARADGAAPVAGTHLYQYCAVTAGRAYITVRNLDIRRARFAVQFGGDGCRMQNCSVSDCANSAALWSGNYSGIQVTSNNIARVGYTAIYSQFSHNGYIAYNTIATVTNVINGANIGGGELCGIGLQQGTNNVVEHNSISDTAQSFVDFYYEADAQVRYNYGVGTADLVAAPMGTGIKLHHNIFVTNGGKGFSSSHSWDAGLSPAPDTGPVVI